MHHGFTYGDNDDDNFNEEEDAPQFDADFQHQHQQQDQIQALPASTSLPQPQASPFRVHLKIPTGFDFTKQRAEDGAYDDDIDADASPDDDQDYDMVNARDLGPTSDDVRPMRRSTRTSNQSQASGSEYAQTQSGSPDALNGRAGTTTSSRGRTIAKVSYNEDDVLPYGDDDDDDEGPRPSRRKRPATRGESSRPLKAERDLDGFVEPDPEEQRRRTRLQEKRLQERERRKNEPRQLVASNANRRPAARNTRNSMRGRVVQSSDEYAEDDDVDDDDDEDDDDGDAAHTTPSPTRPDADVDADGEPEVDGEDEAPRGGRITRGRTRTQRKRKSSDDEDDGVARYPLRPRGKVDYRIPMPFEDLPFDPKDRLPPQRPRPKTARAGPSVGFGPLPFPARPGDDSDSDGFTRTPRRPLPGAAAAGGLFGAGGAAGMFHSDMAAAAGTPSNLGRLGAPDAAALADVDPLGVNQNVTFDDVGGLEEHVASLKEMTLLPLLYPELFQRFNVTPPRGVLFHGPPGTGKTLLARALAASCRSGGRSIAFFMRKGADCLSKWVGEAERQLRLLFEEARNSQPSIIFFDEIDGLAPVRSSKQDQIHASIKMVPSSARSASSTASPLPQQLVPLLDEQLARVKNILNRVIPAPIKRSVLEEAQWEDDAPGGESGALDRELMLQSMETLRIHRPRLVLHGPPGMGQSYLGAAALHHLEAFNVQSLDLGALMSDSTRTVEAAIVQLFVEAKRNQPSIIYIPSLLGWSAAVSEAARTTVRAMLDSLAPTDPILLLALVDGPWNSVPRDVRSWFGIGRENRVALEPPTAAKREAFFAELMKHVRRPPTEFPDAVKRRRRVLEELPVAPPLAPRQPSEAELRILEENDLRTIAQLKHRLNPVLLELKRRFKRFTKAAEQEYGTDALGNLVYQPPPMLHPQPVEEIPTSPTPNGAAQPIVIDSDEPAPQQTNGVEHTGEAPDAPSDLPVVPAPAPVPAQPEPPAEPTMHLIDLERIHVALYSSKYLTPFEFLDDVHKVVENADNMKHYDSERFFRAQALYTTAEVHVHEFEASFLQECNRMAPRERKRREDYKKARAEKKKALQDAAQQAQPALPVPAGTRRSARNNGLQPELTITDPVELERKLKRQRSTDSAGSRGDAATGSGGEEGRASKRARTSGDEAEGVDVFGTVAAPAPVAMDVDLVAGSSSNAMLAPEPMVMTPLSAVPPSIANGQLLNPLPSSPVPVPSTLHDADVAMAQEVQTQPEPPKEPTPPPPRPRTPSPSPGPPPVFTLDESLARAFETKLVSQTGGLGVEQLEQLRAACFDCIWRHRSEWDRDSAVHEMDNIVNEFLAELEEDRESDRDLS
ncbi:hypothetical protein EXIGLDRAFT_752306 [Exidia glandulosa HHB12029]|uniref:AAA+ ATPase domain-containing protein n=1 Tax=Exidia glandulosa HHB12029 TaxID=1314781 RepID=A0A165EN15_EXIGL|nr:hypothetical protein EXIGLDRAFT_752306 [Exidia glandulosa HHB12029]